MSDHDAVRGGEYRRLPESVDAGSTEGPTVEARSTVEARAVGGGPEREKQWKKTGSVGNAGRFRPVAVGVVGVTVLAFISSAALLTRQAASCSGQLCLRSQRRVLLPSMGVPTVAVEDGGAGTSTGKTTVRGRWKVDELLEILQFPGTKRVAEGVANPETWSESMWREQFATWRKEYEKSTEYEEGTSEYEARFRIYRHNLMKIYKHNLGVELFDHENEGVILAPNQFSDLTFAEFKTKYLITPQKNGIDAHGLHRNGLKRIDGSHLSLVALSVLPEEVNWGSKGCVTSIKDQAHCGSCWAFSSTGAVEGAVCAQTGQLPNLSEQQLVDCAGPEGTHGCNGGFMDNAFQYMLDNGGICSEDAYPYEGVQGECRATSCENAAVITGMLDLPVGNVAALQAGVALYGPVSVGIEADRPAFQFYHKGVFNAKCGKMLNHAVLVTGYGTSDGQDYWLVKNSWGKKWGDHGFIKISRKSHKSKGECGILLAPTIPLIEGRNPPSFDNLTTTTQPPHTPY